MYIHLSVPYLVRRFVMSNFCEGILMFFSDTWGILFIFICLIVAGMIVSAVGKTKEKVPTKNQI